jgi:putative MATE family efflux protein
MASMVTLTLYNLIDTFWVSKLGHQAIAALTIVLPYHVLIIAIGIGIGVGIGALTSRRFGERNTEATNHAAGQIFSLAMFYGVIFLVAAAFFSEPILTVIGATPDIMEYAKQYLVILGFGTPFMFFLLMGGSLLRGSGDAVRPMVFTIIAQVANIILDPLLIFGLGPFPEMGIRGAALGTVIGQLIGAGLTFFYIVSGRSVYQIKLAHLKPNLSIQKDIYRVGFPSMIMLITESICFALFNSILSAFGSLALAAIGITIRISDLAFMPIFGVSQGLLPIVGFNFGARLWNRLWRAVKLASGGLALFMAAALLILEIFAPNLIGIFSNDPELIAIAVPAMRIVLSTLVIVGPTLLFVTTFQGLSKGKEALILSLIRQFVFFIPLLFILPRFWGMTGMWLALPVSDILGFIIASLWLVREYRLQQRSGTWSSLPTPRVGTGALTT